MCISVMVRLLPVVTLAVWYVGTVTGQSVVVTTPYGALQGIRTASGSNSFVDVFYNIPYATPPVGQLRFKKPLVNGAWTGTRNATTPGPQCIQPLDPRSEDTSFEGEEDCLYLNVYTPVVSVTRGPLPVMVFIHGGGYFVGSATLYNGTQLANNGVVVVTINYRLGAFGFLTTLDSSSEGNYGLQDQILALQWVRDVISSFNGDPQAVTIFGESAGSSSVSLLILSQTASGLFTKAILESGSSLSPWAMGSASTLPQPREVALQLASRLGCNAGQDTVLALACLRVRSADEVARQANAITTQNGYSMAFRPVAGTTNGGAGTFAAVPEVLLSSGSFNNVLVLRGVNKDEGSLGLNNLDSGLDGFTMEEFRNFTRSIVETWVVREYPVLDVDRVLDLVTETYVTTPNVTDPRQLRAAYVQITTDLTETAPVYKETQLFASGKGLRQYVYRFSYRSANRVTQTWQGVSHGDELPYVFGYPLIFTQLEALPSLVTSWTAEDIQMAGRMMTWWTNFAKYGTPTPTATTWLPWTTSTPRYLDINTDSVMVSASDTPAMQLWNEVLPRLAEQTATGVVG